MPNKCTGVVLFEQNLLSYPPAYSALQSMLLDWANKLGCIVTLVGLYLNLLGFKEATRLLSARLCCGANLVVASLHFKGQTVWLS